MSVNRARARRRRKREKARNSKLTRREARFARDQRQMRAYMDEVDPSWRYRRTAEVFVDILAGVFQ